jgi:uncharacterized protein
MSDIERNKKLTRDFIQAIDDSDIPAIVAAYAEDGRVTTMGNTLISGTYDLSQIKQAASHVLHAFPKGVRYTILNMTAEEDRVAVEALGRGEHSSGKIYDQHYHFLFHWRDGKLVHLKEFMDSEKVTEVLCGGQKRPV